MPYIELEKVSKIYNKNSNFGVTALNEVTLSINKGELVSIVGTSGSGKSSLLHIIGTLDQTTSGMYKLDGKEINQSKNNNLAELRNKEVGFVLQEFGLVLNKSVYENIAIPLYFNKDVKRKQISSLVKKVVKEVGLEEKENSMVAELSGGQKQRVAIARAIVNNPNMILADEPTGALDQKTSQEIIELLKQLNKQGKTVIIVTHDIKVANSCDRVICISDGSILEDKKTYN